MSIGWDFIHGISPSGMRVHGAIKKSIPEEWTWKGEGIRFGTKGNILGTYEGFLSWSIPGLFSIFFVVYECGTKDLWPHLTGFLRSFVSS
jgi:hypothetical protein